MRKIIAEYQNGNYKVTLYSDGTKVKETDDDFFLAAFPDSIDLKITEYCDMFCPMCHEESTTNGRHAKLDHPILNTLKPGMELAIGGGNPLSHPELVEFLERMKHQGVICNMTVNEAHLWKYKDLIEILLRNKLIYGLGISLSQYKKETIEFAKKYKNTVLHLIAGIANWDSLFKLEPNNTKILILGYKKFGRGIQAYNEIVENKIKETIELLPTILKTFDTVGFDNLALEQLDIKSMLTEEEWREFYMGEDGSSTMYIDLVKNEFAVSSTSKERYPLVSNIEDAMSFIHNIIKK